MKLNDIKDRFKAIIFDMDGSLIDSMWLWLDLDIEYFKRFNKEMPEDFQSKIEGMSFTETATYMKEKFGFPDSIEKMMDDFNEMAYYKYTHEVFLKPGAKEFLDFCKANEIKLGIATSNSRQLVNSVANVLGFAGYFDFIMTACEAKKGKPSPDIYLAVAESLNITPDLCLVFEDIPAGIMAGKNAGMTVCAVEDDYSKNSREEKIKLADYYINDFRDLF